MAVENTVSSDFFIGVHARIQGGGGWGSNFDNFFLS